MQNDNPISDFLDVMNKIARNNQSPIIGIGEVISTTPLKILYNGIELDEKELWVNDYLLTDHKRTAKGHIVSATQNRGGGSGDPAYESHNHDIHNDYTDTIITTDTDLKVGFRVAIMPMQDSTDNSKQQFIVLCHIRRPDGNYS